MKARLFVCTTCDRYALPAPNPSRGETMLAAVEAAADRLGAAGIVNAVPCVNSCPRPCGAAVREGRGGGMFRFAQLAPADADALVAFALRRAAGDLIDVPDSLARRVASYTMPRT